jgi:hypothetical protein
MPSSFKNISKKSNLQSLYQLEILETWALFKWPIDKIRIYTLLSIQEMIAHTKAAVISKLLVDEASTGHNDTEGWNAVVNTYVLNLLQIRRMENLNHPTRLAIAIAIVGSQRLELYTTAFRLLW